MNLDYPGNLQGETRLDRQNELTGIGAAYVVNCWICAAAHFAYRKSIAEGRDFETRLPTAF